MTNAGGIDFRAPVANKRRAVAYCCREVRVRIIVCSHMVDCRMPLLSLSRSVRLPNGVERKAQLAEAHCYSRLIAQLLFSPRRESLRKGCDLAACRRWVIGGDLSRAFLLCVECERHGTLNTG